MWRTLSKNKLSWIGWGVALTGWLAAGMWRFGLPRLGRTAGMLAILVAVVGYTLNLVGAIRENKMKRLAEHAEASSSQLEQAG